MNNKISRVCSQPLSSIIFLVGPSFNLPLHISLLSYLIALSHSLKLGGQALQLGRLEGRAPRLIRLWNQCQLQAALSLFLTLSPSLPSIYLSHFVSLSFSLYFPDIYRKRKRKRREWKHILLYQHQVSRKLCEFKYGEKRGSGQVYGNI